MLNPKWLKTFVTLIDVGHFTQTADKLFMTQPGVSQHISKLEQACGHALIKRDKKSFSITEQGRLVYSYAKKLSRDEQALLNKLTFDDPYSGDCAIACSGSTALSLYPKLLTLQVEHPELIIKLKAAPNVQILQDILNGNVDLGIVTDLPNSKLFDASQIAEKELCLIVPADCEANSDTAQLLIELGLISHPDAEDYLSLYCAKSEIPKLQQLDIAKIPVVGSINQIGQILEPIAQGIGFTVLPQAALDSFVHKQKVKVIKPNQDVTETLYLIKKKNRILPNRYHTLQSLIPQI